jgi:hypothetical protein
MLIAELPPVDGLEMVTEVTIAFAGRIKVGAFATDETTTFAPVVATLEMKNGACMLIEPETAVRVVSPPVERQIDEVVAKAMINCPYIQDKPINRYVVCLRVGSSLIDQNPNNANNTTTKSNYKLLKEKTPLFGRGPNQGIV